MFFPESEEDLADGGLLARLFDITGCKEDNLLAPFRSSTRVGGRNAELTSCGRTTEVDTDRGTHALEAVDVSPVKDTITHHLKDLGEVGATEVRARLEFSQRIEISTDGVEHDVLRRVHIELLGEVGVDLEELHATATGNAGGLVTLSLERGEESLEPLEGPSILADPNKLNTSQPGGWVGTVAEMPDIFQDGSPGGNTDTSTDQHRNFIVKHILSRGTIGSVDSEAGHLLAVLKGNFVHAKRVDAIVKLSLGGTGTNSITEGAGEISNLPNVYGDIGVVGARSDGKRMPLILGDGRDLKEEPLTSLVLERRFRELDLNDI